MVDWNRVTISWKHFIEKYVLFLKEDEGNLGISYPTINLVSKKNIKGV